MKKTLIFLIVGLILSMYTKTYAEQYVLSCKIKISALQMYTDKVLRSYIIDRYFIVDTVLEGVYDANNLPLDVQEFSSSQIAFSKRAQSFADAVDTKLVYNRHTHEITLNEIYAYSSKFDQRARFVTKGIGTCKETKINRTPLF
jgi:hypothetical protein